MEDSNSKKTLSLSSPKNPSSSSGNNENESESKRNSVQNQNKQASPKNFMASTISTASKTISPKKKILAEWKEAYPRSSSNKVGNSNSSAPSRKSSPKSPSLSSTPNSKEVLGVYGGNNEEDFFVPGPSTTPYDPHTNYLSPRPKFLRYNPNRRREIAHRMEGGNVGSLSLRDFLDSEGSSAYITGESSLKQENGENGDSDEKVDVEEEEEEEEEKEEEVIEERESGLKWIINSLIVLAVLVISTRYISTVNSHIPLHAYRELNDICQNFYNRTFGAVSMRDFEFGGWVFDEREISEMGVFEINEIDVDQTEISDMGEVIEGHEIEIEEKIGSLASLKDRQEEDVVPIDVDQALNPGIEEQNVVSDLESNDEQIEKDVEIVVSDSVEVNEEETLVDYEEEMVVSEANSKGVKLANEEEIVLEDPHKGIKEEYMTVFGKEVAILADDTQIRIKEEDKIMEEEHIPDHGKEVADSEPKSEDKGMEKEYQGIEVEKMADYGKEMVDSEPKSEYKGMEEEDKGSELEDMADYGKEMANSEVDFLENEEKRVRQHLMDQTVEGNLSENKDKPVYLTPTNVVWLVVSSVMTLVSSLLVRFYFKCKKASSKTISSSNVKLCSQAGMVEKSNSKLPPKVGGEKVVQQINNKKLDSYPNPPSVIQSREEKVEMAPPRIIPKVKVLGELVIGGEFSSSIKSCSMQNKMHESEEISNFSLRQERRAPTLSLPSRLENSDVDSVSYGSYSSQKRTTTKKMEGGKEGVSKMTPTPLRRSSRIRSRSVTSP